MRKLFIIVLLGVSLALAGCVQQAPIQDQNLNQPTVNQPANQNQNINQPVMNVNQDANINGNQPTDPTANWLTFTNNELGYAVKYPQEFSAKEWAETIKAGGPSEVNDWLLSQVAFGNNTQLGDWQISVSISSKTLGQEKELVKISVANAWKNQEEILIDGIKSTKYTGAGGEGVTGKIITILVPYENKVYKLAYSEANDKVDRSKIFDQMIQTFKFNK